MCLNFLFVDDTKCKHSAAKKRIFLSGWRNPGHINFAEQINLISVLIHTGFQLEPTTRSSASPHRVHRMKDIVKDNIKDNEILFLFNLMQLS